jgi:hypothetical protein
VVLWQEMYGVIPHIQGKGKAAAQVSDILSRMQREQPRPPPASVCQAFWGGQSPLVISPIYLSLLSMSISNCKNMKPLDAGTGERGSLMQFDVISSTSNHLHTDISVCMIVKGNLNS